MSGSKQLIILAICYSIIILGTMYLSGRSTQRTLYNTYFVKFEGVRLAVSDREKSRKFYLDILDLESRPVAETGVDALRLPGDRFLFLEEQSATTNRNRQSVLIKVRNGFKQLHRVLVERLGGQPKAVPGGSDPCSVSSPGSISEIVAGPRGSKSFSVIDPDGNCLLLFQPARRSGSWR